ncbi:MAG TPA: GNAT family N-acetyltransferase [Galbitalea sp.]
MKPVTLRTTRLTLDQPILADVDLVTEYCQDPLFETYLTTPWPYRRENAVNFLTGYVPGAWQRGTEYSWAIRRDSELLGLIGFRTERRDIGFWIGAPHRGNGYMTEATTAVLDWLFQEGHDNILWECFLGNVQSVSVARKVGFTFTGVAESVVARRDGSHPPAWHGTIAKDDSREPKPGWPV